VAFDGSEIWVTDNGTNTISRISISGTPAIDAVVTVGNGANYITFDGQHLWVTNATDNTVSEVDPVSKTVIATVHVGGGPFGPCFDGTYVWVPNANGETQIDAATAQIVTTVPVSGAFCAYDGRQLWTGSYRIDPVFGSYTSGTVAAHGLAFDGTNMWITDFANGAVYRVPAG
jgi:YVTN family beta-propeller protein